MPSRPEARRLEINYRRDGPPFMELVEQIENANVIAVMEEHRSEIELLQEGLNDLYAMASQFAWLLNAPHIAYPGQAPVVIFSTFHKNLIALYSSLKLTRSGLFGPARSMLRHAYEALIVAKFCSVSESTRVYEKWKDGDVVYFTNSVLKKIAHPSTEAFAEFWELMSGYSHATIYAQQITLNVGATPKEVPLNLVYIRILLECQYHLLTGHLVTPSMRYYAKRYRRGPDPAPALRARMKSVLDATRSSLLNRPREIIRNYRAAWHVIA